MTKDDKTSHLLIVEDNLGDFVLVEEFLNEQFDRVKLTHFKTYWETKHFLTDMPPGECPDVILLDLSLPDKKGSDLIDEMIELAGQVPLIILTGYSDLSFSVKSLAKGVSDYLLKDDLSPALLYKSIIYSIERNQYSAKVRSSERNYRDLFELSPQPMYVFDLDTFEFLDVNKAAVDHYGYTKDEFQSMTIRDIRPAQEIPLLEKAVKVANTSMDKVNAGIFVHQKKSGELIKVKITTTIIRYQGRRARIVLAEDVTEKQKEEERLKLLESVITNSTEAVVILDATSSEDKGRKILYVNDAFSIITGYSPEEAVGNTLYILNGPETDELKRKQLKEAMDSWTISEVELVNYKKDGSVFWTNTSFVPVSDGKGGNSHWVAIGRDITERKNYEFKLKESLHEKEILLAEIHHRVKNNLAVVSAMMQLQAFEEGNKGIEKKLYDSISRISTMGTIHELLYQSGSFSQLRFSEIIETLVSDIDGIMNDGTDIKHIIEKEDIQLNINQAIPCALIINEVITNIYKHAFNGRNSGVIDIKLSVNHDKVHLKISDNGSGFPEDKEIEDLNSLGLNIIRILTSQLEGSSEYRRLEKGTGFALSFNKAEKSGSGNAMLK